MSRMPLDHRKIAHLRGRLQLTLDEAARRAGLKTRQQWWNIENGTRPNISVDTLYRVSRALGCTADDLIIPPDQGATAVEEQAGRVRKPGTDARRNSTAKQPAR
jgi:transcriptional regulator with XRE-family HTH domain